MSINKADIDSKLHRQIRSFREKSLGELLTHSVLKRREWISRRIRKTARSWTPREAYELFLLDYLGLDSGSVPIVSETDDEIVWDSLNECPTLEACQHLGLDTRTVCRQIYEKSTQAFLSDLDPQLRFWRSYEHIRPYASSCREAIYKIQFETMMRFALEQAESARAEGQVGNGAVMVFYKEIIATGHDRSKRTKDSNEHVETHVIRKAQRVLGDSDLCGCILFVTIEPCAACVKLATEANLTTIVFGAFEKDICDMGVGRNLQCRQPVEEDTVNWIEIIGGIGRNECIAGHQRS
jgi:tRNA(Arg) A34 adenosine deaminase TadA